MKIKAGGRTNKIVRTFEKNTLMPVKLNLSVKAETAKRIKHFAARNKTTVSKLAEDQFDKLTKKPKAKGKTFAATYAGTLTHHIPDINVAKDEYLKEKYGI